MIKKKICDEIEKLIPLETANIEFQTAQKIMKEEIIKVIKKVVL